MGREKVQFDDVVLPIKKLKGDCQYGHTISFFLFKRDQGFLWSCTSKCSRSDVSRLPTWRSIPWIAQAVTRDHGRLVTIMHPARVTDVLRAIGVFSGSVDEAIKGSVEISDKISPHFG